VWHASASAINEATAWAMAERALSVDDRMTLSRPLDGVSSVTVSAARGWFTAEGMEVALRDVIARP
jgi:hypothetical protein